MQCAVADKLPQTCLLCQAVLTAAAVHKHNQVATAATGRHSMAAADDCHRGACHMQTQLHYETRCWSCFAAGGKRTPSFCIPQLSRSQQAQQVLDTPQQGILIGIIWAVFAGDLQKCWHRLQSNHSNSQAYTDSTAAQQVHSGPGKSQGCCKRDGKRHSMQPGCVACLLSQTS